MTFVEGRLAVATPIIASPPFARAVVLILEHDDSGAIGLILNAATDLKVVDHLPELEQQVSEPATVFLGGPVTTEVAVVLARSSTAEFLQPSGVKGVGIVDILNLPDTVDAMRVFAGYSGWEAQQLESEIEEGAWWIIDPTSDDLFHSNTEGMWERTVRRAPGTIPFHERYPADIGLN
ncbi:MAG: YqgE/AlgH family protein [Acidimicrobiia bacterium]